MISDLLSDLFDYYQIYCEENTNPKNLSNVNFSKVFVKMDIESRDK